MTTYSIDRDSESFTPPLLSPSVVTPSVVTPSVVETPPKIPQKIPLTITSGQRRTLRSLGHALRPVVQIGRGGLSEGVIEATKEALAQHELIKVSINGESPTERKSGSEHLGALTGGHIIQVIGRVILLYRQDPKEPKISLPRVKRSRVKRSK